MGLVLDTELGDGQASVETWTLWDHVLNIPKHRPVTLSIHENVAVGPVCTSDEGSVSPDSVFPP